MYAIPVAMQRISCAENSSGVPLQGMAGFSRTYFQGGVNKKGKGLCVMCGTHKPKKTEGRCNMCI